MFGCRRWLVLLCLAWLPLAAIAAELILSFDSDIRIQQDASLLVTETIRFYPDSGRATRGIFRDFPTTYKDAHGNNYRTSFEVLEVRRNGNSEPWRAEDYQNGIRLRIGSANVFLTSGEHEYEITYRTTRQMGYFDNHDELWWNVTGDGWPFPIQQASATLRLPEPVNRADLGIDAWTGAYGSREQAVDMHVVDGSTARYRTTRILSAREGLSVLLTFPKGLVYEPDQSQRIAWFLADNVGVLAMLLGLAVPLIWYLWAWRKVGRDPDKGVIIPRFEPPKGLTPAACRYVLDMGMREAAFTAAVISLGVKGYLRIDEDDGDFTLTRQPGRPSRKASPGESAVMEAVLPGGTSSVKLDNDNHSEFGRARQGLSKALAGEHKGRLFSLNSIYATPAIIASVAGMAVGLALGAPKPTLVVYVPLSFAIHALFIFLLRAPTPAGRRIMDEIEGFRMYLGTAERDRLEMMKSPEITPEVFEAFLPYSFALGVENSWCQRFQDELPHLQEDRHGYHPAWYHGNLRGASAMNHIGSDLSSGLSSAISSAATPPGSSSGSGGGGFSGGGGGGGGGGSW